MSAFETAVWEQNLRRINPQKGGNDATTTVPCARAAESGVTVVSSSGSTAYYGLKMGDVRGHGKEIDADQTDRQQRPHQAADQTFDLLFSM